jgi:hypothetical protein
MSRIRRDVGLELAGLSMTWLWIVLGYIALQVIGVFWFVRLPR